MAETYKRNKVLTLESSITVQENIIISIYEWSINNTINSNNTPTLTINTNDLNLGENFISLRVKNSCGTWSDDVTKVINIIDEVINMEKTVTVVVDEPIKSVLVVLDYMGTIEVTASDGVNPVSGAAAELDGVLTQVTTGTDGKLSIPNVPYGTHEVKIIK